MLVLIHPQLVLAVLETLLYGPAHHGSFAHFIERGIFRSVGKGALEPSVRIHPHEEPYGIVSRKAFSGWINPKTGHLGDNRPFCAFSKHNRLPSEFGRSRDLGHFL
jgi:hypothetical protein